MNKKKDKMIIGQGYQAYRKIAAEHVEKLPGLYLHIPFCRKKCDYCDFYSVPAEDDKAAQYTEALIAHLEEAAGHVGSPVETVYIGGGTPAMLGTKNLTLLLGSVRKLFKLAANPEITVELNPESTDKKLLKSLKKSGCTRLSIGIQSAVDEELKRLGRLHNYEDAKKAVALARETGFHNISVDLMYGIEGQTAESLAYSLREILGIEPEHISCYGLKVEENTPLWQRREEADLPDDDDQAEYYEIVCETLKRAGYMHYEISNFAKPGYASRHNLKYWKLEPYLGFGPGAHSDFGGRRFSYVRSVDAYIDGIKSGGEVIDYMEEVPLKERATEYLMLRLRLTEGFDPSEYVRLFSRSCEPVEAKLREYETMGLASYNGRWALTTKGFLMSNSIISSLI
jgi:putative oxygen-independent coproporphyrinogen III oxidase